MKNKKILILLLVLFCAGIAVYLTRDTITPYVSFGKAAESDSSVQIIGKLDQSKDIIYEAGSMLFELKDDAGKSMRVSYNGVKPNNFEQAEQIVAIGKYNKNKQIFESDKILTKCPSKYEKKNQDME